jgi:hypothetical protein
MLMVVFKSIFKLVSLERYAYDTSPFREGFILPHYRSTREYAPR